MDIITSWRMLQNHAKKPNKFPQVIKRTVIHIVMLKRARFSAPLPPGRARGHSKRGTAGTAPLVLDAARAAAPNHPESMKKAWKTFKDHSQTFGGL